MNDDDSKRRFWIVSILSVSGACAGLILVINRVKEEVGDLDTIAHIAASKYWYVVVLGVVIGFLCGLILDVTLVAYRERDRA